MSTKRPPRSPGRIATHVVLVAAIGYMVGLIVQPGIEASKTRADLKYVLREAEALRGALDRFHEQHQAYPNGYSEPRLDLQSLDPLRKRHYYQGGITRKLVDGRIDAYDSPDDQGLNNEYWFEMTLARDPSLRVLVARSDDAPLSNGNWCDGVQLYRDGRLETN